MSIDAQLHGYRQGHELLSATISLDRTDQSVVDQLSDVAGPLRPGEVFEPYLTAYPLPSGSHFVLARTWQDLTVQRAGCVRTLSLIVPIDAWQEAPGLKQFLSLLEPKEFPSEAIKRPIAEPRAAPLPIPNEFRAYELLEALFLEDSKPVAVFDAPDPELIAVRLLTSLWPSMRRRFALSTFALSPRRIEGRPFDLVFAPKDARSRFSDWPGRRVDGRADQSARHRWSDTIASRVFYEPIPRLLSESNAQFADGGDAGGAAALRISLLWDELLEKLDRSPAAALGLVDIANTKLSSDGLALDQLKAALSSAPRRAVAELISSEAWDFIGAMARKLQGTRLSDQIPWVARAASDLASQDPDGAITLLSEADAPKTLAVLIPEIADGIGRGFGQRSEDALIGASPSLLTTLVGSSTLLAQPASTSKRLIPAIGQALKQAAPSQLAATRETLLPLLTVNEQLPIAKPLFESLSVKQLQLEVQQLARANDFAADTFYQPLANRARALGAMKALRSTLLLLPTSERRNSFLAKSLSGVAEDIHWILETADLDAATSASLLTETLSSLPASAFPGLFKDYRLADAVLAKLHQLSPHVVQLILESSVASPAAHIDAAMKLLPALDGKSQERLAHRALQRAISAEFGGDETSTLVSLLDIVGDLVDCELLARGGMISALPPGLVSRNLVAFQRAAPAARDRIAASIDKFARAYVDGRWLVELDTGGAEAFAHLLWDAQATNGPTCTQAAGVLLPLLMRSTRSPVSMLLAAAFPPVYRELAAKADDVLDVYKFVPFFDWDRCKAARRELVEAYLSATAWAPGDFALTACLSADVEQLVEKAARASGSSSFLERMANDLQRLPPKCAEQIERALARHGRRAGSR